MSRPGSKAEVEDDKQIGKKKMSRPASKADMDDDIKPVIEDKQLAVVAAMSDGEGDEGDEESIFQQSRKTRTTKMAKGEGPAAKTNLSFQNLTVTVRGKRGRLTLLNKVSGYVPVGEVLMIMGSSGSGKSTLLETIASIKKPGVETSGDIFFNSKRLKPADFREIVSFVPQEAALLGEFTVKETLWFSARLYFGYFKIDHKIIEEKINHIIESVGLKSCENVVVGNLFVRGLSGGQRRRLSIAVELISSPSVLVLDEPTSGLDSAAAESIVEALYDLAKEGHTVIATIHQPSSKIWAQFKNVLLLSKGRTCFYGARADVGEYFSTIGLSCPAHFNPADYYVAILSTEFPWSEPVPTVDEIADKFDQSAYRKIHLQSHLDKVVSGRKTIVGLKKKSRTEPSRVSAKRVINSNSLGGQFDDLDIPQNKRSMLLFSSRSIKRSGFFSSFLALLLRCLLSLMKNFGILATRIILYVAVGLILGLTYLNLGASFDDQSIMGRASLILGGTGFFTILSVAAIPFILDNRAVVKRERANGSYETATFVLAYCLALIPMTFVLAMIASMFLVLMVQLNNFMLFFFALWVLIYNVECISLSFGMIFLKPETGTGAAVGFLGVLLLCSGFFVPVNEMNWALRWIAYINPLRFGFRALMRNEFDSISSFDSLQFHNGSEVIEFFHLNDDVVQSYWGDVGILFSFVGTWLCILYLATKYAR